MHAPDFFFGVIQRFGPSDIPRPTPTNERMLANFGDEACQAFYVHLVILPRQLHRISVRFRVARLPPSRANGPLFVSAIRSRCLFARPSGGGRELEPIVASRRNPGRLLPFGAYRLGRKSAA